MIRAEHVVVGAVLYDNHTYRMGNTTMRAMGEWEVKILEVIDSLVPGAPSAVVSWNGNPPQRWSWISLRKLHRTSLRERAKLRRKCEACGRDVRIRADGKLSRHRGWAGKLCGGGAQ